MPRRTRLTLVDQGSGEWAPVSPPGAASQPKSYPYAFYDWEETISENHSWPPPKGNRFDIGGDFSSIKQRTTYNSPTQFSKLPTSIQAAQYSGKQFAVTRSVTRGSQYYPPVTMSPASQLYSLGSTAISRILPTNPAFDAAQFAGELFVDKVPQIVGQQLIRERLRDFRSIGDEYLNVEFGWKPFISDLLGFAKTVKSAHRVLKQYKRDSDKLIRRRYEFPTEETTDSVVLSTTRPADPALPTSQYRVLNGTLTKTSQKTTRRWLSAAFRYHLQGADTLLGRMEQHVQMANHLLGIVPTPETLWELTPWSWAADWVSNTGDIIHNFSRFSSDGLVMPWAYMMEHIKATDTYTLTGTQLINCPPQTLIQSFTTESKVRVHAIPFGFGLSPSTFTGKQWAILGALGLSRSPGQLARG